MRERIGHDVGHRRRERRFAKGSRESGRQVTSDTLDAPRVGTIALDADVKDHVRRDAERVEESLAHARGDELIEDHESEVIVAQTQLAGRAQHPVTGDAAHLAPDDLETARQHGADGREGHVIATFEVRGAADDFERPVAGVDRDEAHAVGALDRTDLVDACDDDVLESRAHQIDSLNYQSEVVEDEAQFIGRFAELDEFA